MRIFVSEYLCSGAWPEPELLPSLAREGRAMLLAVLADLSALPDVTLCSTWDARLGEFPCGRGATGFASANCRPASNCNGLAEPVAHGDSSSYRRPSVGLIECVVIDDPGDEAAVFRRLAGECDATYVIAPELDDRLSQRVRTVRDAGGRSLNASLAAIAVCSDKWATFQQLSAAGIATVPTALFDAESPKLPFDFPLVLKPRFGAGSQDTFLIRDANASGRQQLASSNRKSKIENRKSGMILQPYIPGRTLSVAAVFRSDGTLREVFPVGDQVLSEDGRFTYLGGCLPADRIERDEVAHLISEVSRCVPGLRGYIGFDLILPDDERTPLIVDINPRLTTSYLGYRALADGNLAGRILWPDREWPTVEWRREFVGFDAGGHVIRPPAGFGSEWQ